MNSEDHIPHPEDQIIVKRSSAPEDLGPLRGQVWLTIQTHQAQQLIRGRNGTHNKPAIIGLVGFADRLRVIWQAARNDDPYADWWLIKVHEAIERAGDTIRNRQKEMDDLLIQSAIEVNIAGSLRPYRMLLQFANPYAYQGANLLSKYDRLVCTVLTARHVGLLDSKTSNELIQNCAGKIRSTFTIPQSYRFLKIDRESLRNASGNSREACQAMGEIPTDVLSGEHHAPIVPRKVGFPTGFTSHIGLHPESSASSKNLSADQNNDG